MTEMAIRKKRSISLPPELDGRIEKAAETEGKTYSGWLAELAHREFTIRAGLEGVAAYEREYGAFSVEELEDANAWVIDTLGLKPARGRRARRSK